MPAVVGCTPEGRLIRKAGVVSVVVARGAVRAGDEVSVKLPAAPHRAPEPV